MVSFMGGDPPPKLAGRTEFTSRFLVLGRHTHDASLPKMLRDKAGLTVAASSDFPRGTVDMGRFGGADGVYFEQLGVAVTSSAPNQLAPLAAPGAGSIVAVERERVVYMFHVPQRDYAPMTVPTSIGHFGPQHVDTLVCSVSAPSLTRSGRDADESSHTWGLVSTKVVDSSRTGRSVRVAVLDSGFDLQHPDFVGRSVVNHCFVDGEQVQDGNSHGTHCIGTALGPARPPSLPRYGVAAEAEIYVGKVLSNQGRGTDGSILAAINWAIANGCRIVSMSLGSAAQRGDPPSQVYETVGQRALAQNTLIIAAAGNESERSRNVINPVGHPANCPSIMAVGAVDANMQIADFSTRGMDPNGGGIDLVAPGVNVYSSVPLPKAHGRKNGTSMACPHVAGIAALWAEANPSASARDLWQLLINNALPLRLDPSDAGAGLAQAPR
jgi:subtilisin family serine protease